MSTEEIHPNLRSEYLDNAKMVRLLNTARALNVAGLACGTTLETVGVITGSGWMEVGGAAAMAIAGVSLCLGKRARTKPMSRKSELLLLSAHEWEFESGTPHSDSSEVTED